MSTKSITPKDYNPKKFGRKNKVKEKITVGSDGIRAISPFTGEYDVVIEQDDKNGESRMCVKSGYNTSELFIILKYFFHNITCISCIYIKP